MSHRKHDAGKMHDKSRGMVKETSRERFMEEQREMAHELSHHRSEIEKLINDDYIATATSRSRNQYIVKFQHPTTHRMEKVTFHYEANFVELEPLWHNMQH
ncbi:MAG: hypothetical protein JXO44_08765 [Clostridia bacterium]|nr:hypothetical protein [Clostridia bacterium]